MSLKEQCVVFLAKVLFYNIVKVAMMENSPQNESKQRFRKNPDKYYKEISQSMKNQFRNQGFNENKFDSYYVSLLKGKQRTREMPKELQSQLERTISQSYGSVDEGMKKSMEKTAVKINEERERRGDQSGQIQRLVRLARLHYLSTREQRIDL